jgi:methionyl-tRNA formyltransferase
MNIVFMGTPEFAVESLSKIYESGHNIIAVVSQPDRPSGRGMKLQPTPVKSYALEKNIKIYQPEKVRKNPEFIQEIKNLNPDVIVVVAFGQILPKELLDIPKYGSVNVHGSLLPKYRGAAPIQWSIINGDKVTGITTMYMDAGMDTGDMILKAELNIDEDDTFGTLHDKMKKLGAKLIVETLERVSDENAPRIKQTGDYTMAPMIEKDTCKIVWSKTATEIRNLIRGLNPVPAAYTMMDGKVIKICSASVVENKKVDEIPGTIITADDKDGVQVVTGDGVLKILEIHEQCCRKMSCKEYLCGRKLRVGDILL